jgi:hypothetical protein
MIYFGAIALLRWRIDLSLLWWWVGGFFGAGVLWVDRLVYVYVTAPHEQLSIQVQHVIRDKRLADGLKLLRARGTEQGHLVSLSGVFMAAWVAAAIYVLSSTGSMVAVGMVMGVGLRLVHQIGQGYGERERLKSELFWQIKRPISDREFYVVVVVFLAAFCLLSLAVV